MLCESVEREVESFIHKIMRDDGIPGLSIGVTNGSGSVYVNGFGARDLSRNKPMDQDTLFGLGSVTKSFTALGILQLCERGELELDHSVSEYVPLTLGDDITIHHLLSHSAGVPSNGMAKVLLGRLTEVDETKIPMSDFDEFFAHVNGAESHDKVAQPGERFFYYASGYTILGKIIENITGQSYESYMEDKVFDPLSMDRTTFDRESFTSDPNAMTAYHNTDGDLEERPYPFHPLLAATGGLMTSVSEGLRYVDMLLNKGQFEGQAVLDEKLVDKLLMGQIDTPDDLYGRYGYGWITTDFLGRQYVGHSGNAVTGTASIAFLPEDDIGVVVGCNTAPGYRLSRIAQGILAAVLNEDPMSKLPFYARPRAMNKLDGEYHTYDEIFTADVTRDGGLLRVNFDGIGSSRHMHLIPSDDDTRCTKYYTLTEAGERIPVEFDITNKSIRMFYDRYCFHKTIT